MKVNSKVLGILLALFAVSMLISATSAGDLVKNDFGIGNFAVDIPSGSDFSENVTTSLNTDYIAMNLVIFENTGAKSEDVDSIIYFKDSSDNKTMISDFTNDLNKDGDIVEKTDKYVVLKTKNSNSFDIDDLSGAFDFAEGLFSSDGVNMTADGNSISFSSQGLEISDANGENVSITSDGINVSAEASSDDDNFNVSGNMDVSSSINEGDYSIYLHNSNNDTIVVINGNNLELMKEMAESTSLS